MAERMKIICDCDNTMGAPARPIDDGQTLLYLLGRDDIEILGITTTFGNGPIDIVYDTTARLLRDLGREDIPLFKGEGRRGEPPTEAAHFLAETVAAHPGEVSVLAIGPVGNLRAAAELDPDFYRHVRQIACMGGYLQSLPIPGWENVPELNLSCDPEAALDMLRAPCPVTLMTAQACLQAPFGLPELARVAQFDQSVTYRHMRAWLQVCDERHQAPTDYLWDLVPAVYLSYPELFEPSPTWVRSTVSDLERGMIIVGREGEGARINLPPGILDVERFYALLYEAWEKEARRRGAGRG